MPIGIIVWLILIIVIGICSNPGILTTLFILIPGVIVGLYLIYLISKWLLCFLGYIFALVINWINPGFLDKPQKPIDDNKTCKSQTLQSIMAKTDREKAIDEWERKWEKRHPSRK